MGFDGVPSAAMWRLLVAAARRAAEEQGFRLIRVPGRGLSNVWRLEKGGNVQVASIRTTRDRWIAFPPLNGGKRWKTLSDVDAVLVAAVDRKEKPEAVQVYLFPADEVRRRFDAAYMAREEDGHVIRDDFGMWVNLDTDNRGIASSVGSGLAEAHRPIAIYKANELLGEPVEDKVMAGSNEKAPNDSPRVTQQASGPASLRTIADVVGWARERIAEIAGVGLDAVKLDLKLEI